MSQRREAHLSHDGHARPRCSICQAGREGTADITRVEALLANGARLRPVAEKFGINAHALRRHWREISENRKNYLRFGARLTAEALSVAVHEEKLETIDHLRIVRAGLHRSFQLAIQSGDFTAIASLSKALTENVMMGAKLVGEWRDEPHTVNNVQVLHLPAVAAVVSGLGKVLSDYPEARRRVVEFLKSAESEAAALSAPEVIDVTAE